MNKRNLMIKAHKIAKSIVAIVGDYMVAMKIALKQAWEEMGNKMSEEKVLLAYDHHFCEVSYAGENCPHIEVDQSVFMEAAINDKFVDQGFIKAWCDKKAVDAIKKKMEIID